MQAQRRLLLRSLPLGILGIYAAFGAYSVESDESAVEFVLGRAASRDVLPGMHWNPPWPFGRVVVAPTATSFTMPIGYRFVEEGRPPISDLWLTGDTNVLTVRMNIQYSIESLADFELTHERPIELLRRSGERVLTRFLLAEGVDGILGLGRSSLVVAVKEGVQSELDTANVGIEVQSVTVEELSPPREGGVRATFQDVQNASSDRERAFLEASAYERQVLAEAEGETERLVATARADRHRRVEIARGEAERFAAIAREHAMAPRVTEERLYLEALERILPGLETYVVEPGEGGKVNLRVVR